MDLLLRTTDAAPPAGKIRRLFGAQDPPPFVPVPVTWRVVVFSADGVSDPLARGRELAAAERSSRPGHGQPGGAGRITRALEALEERFASQIEAMGSPQDGYVAASDLDAGMAFDLTPGRVEIRTYGLTYFPPTRGGTLFRDAAQAIVSAGDFDTVYDPQLDRLVTFPADTDAISAAWVKAFEREVARVTA
ncbi:MAG: hypothetical protein JHD16_09090 [Solirubrobacteraceae bacterium]|nr:hypothetical protein [Solirubrobacteraceae bacterium]